MGREKTEKSEATYKRADVIPHISHPFGENGFVADVTIRGEPHSVIEAIERQMYHYSYHIGQIVYIAKQLNANNWKTLTIPRNRKTT
ncbi:DUF1572 family protein [Geobacillus sp. FSL W8-0466]|uniref:DUF1572 family protein n=1 Tax=Bacillus sp. FSL W8-0672 TaxID=2954628 RepID=UPI0028775646|nr:DUF1572 family protein [Geobacillus stearothermophilus]